MPGWIGGDASEIGQWADPDWSSPCRSIGFSRPAVPHHDVGPRAGTVIGRHRVGRVKYGRAAIRPRPQSAISDGRTCPRRPAAGHARRPGRSADRSAAPTAFPAPPATSRSSAVSKRHRRRSPSTRPSTAPRRSQRQAARSRGVRALSPAADTISSRCIASERDVR